MSKLWSWFLGLVGNSGWAKVGVFAFIALFLVLGARCARADEFDVRTGVSFGNETGLALGAQYYHDLPLQGMRWYAGTTMWGAGMHGYAPIANNWDWHTGLEACHGRLCARLGADYLQRIDALNGAHTNFNLGITYRFDWGRVAGVSVDHISDAGTTPVNVGRQAALVEFRLQ